jgi:hypothetical protein
MDLGNLANTITYNIDVLRSAMRLAPWLPWAQALAVAGSGGALGWLARSVSASERKVTTPDSMSVNHKPASEDHWDIVAQQLEVALARRHEAANQHASAADLLNALAQCTDDDLAALLGTEPPAPELDAIRAVVKERLERRRDPSAAKSGDVSPQATSSASDTQRS